jgi:hypothetical protein
LAAIAIFALPGHLDNADIPIMLAQRQKINHPTINLGFPRSPPNGIGSLAGKYFKGAAVSVLLIKTAKTA